MISVRMIGKIAVAVLAVNLAPIGVLQASAASTASGLVYEQPEGEAQYMRVRDLDNGDRVQLQVAVRKLRPVSGEGPVVNLVGVIHIADAKYYEQMQQFLDGQSLVLFEGVKPGELGETDAASAEDKAKVKLTQSRIRRLAILMDQYKAEHKEYPENLNVLVKSLMGTQARLAGAARLDAWGRELLLEMVQTKIVEGEKVLWRGTSFDLISAGSDGKEGGEGGAADLRFSDQPALSSAERSTKDAGIQSQLAKALGLEFQLAAIDYTREKWRNSDMSATEVQAKLKEAGIDAEAFFSMMDGRSLGSKIVGMLLGFLERDPQMAMMVKVMLVETISNADQIMESQPGNMGKMMKVIVNDRNDVVLEDLRNAMKEEMKFETIALFYGAGHLPHLEESIVADMNYTLDSVEWFTAIDLDLTKVPGAKAQSKQMRAMIKSMTKSMKPE